MPRLAERLRAWTRGEKSASPRQLSVPFAVACDCGEVLTGLRQAQFQVLPCPRCQNTVWVAARSPWPAPRVVQLHRVPPPTTAAEAAARSTGTVPAPPPLPVGPAKGTRTEVPPQVPRGAAAPAGAWGLAPTRWMLAWSRLVDALRRWRTAWTTWWTRPRLVALVGLVVVLVTGWWSWTTARQARFARQLESSLAAGRKALVAGDLVSAESALATAGQAARGLGGQTPPERWALQLEREITLWTNHSTKPLEEFLLDPELENPDQVQERVAAFREAYGGRAVIFDIWVEKRLEAVDPAAAEPLPEPDPAAPVAEATLRPVVEASWSLAVGSTRVTLDLANHPLWSDLPPNEPRRVICGARLAGLRPPPAADRPWQVELDLASLTLLTQPGPFQQLGWPVDDPLAEQLMLQAAQLGLETGGPAR